MRYSNLLLTSVLTIFLAACGGGNDHGIPILPSALNEGSERAPVLITVGTARISTVDVLGTSYYAFDTTSNNTATIRLTNTDSDLSWELYRNPDFTGWVMDCDIHFDATEEICTTPTLTNATRYYLRVDEWEPVSESFNLHVTQP